LLFLIVAFFFNDTATTEIYTLSLHDALPISIGHSRGLFGADYLFICSPRPTFITASRRRGSTPSAGRSGLSLARAAPLERETARSEEHTSELQSRGHLVCRLLLEKKKRKNSR